MLAVFLTPLFIGIVFLILSIILFILMKLSEKRKIKITGMIIDMYNSTNSNHYINSDNSAYMKRPIFEYIIDGITYRKVDDISYNINYIKDNMYKKVDVFYNPENPEEASISSMEIFKVFIKIFLLSSIVELLIPVFLFFMF